MKNGGKRPQQRCAFSRIAASIGANIKSHRLEKGMSQAHLAGASGVSVEQIARIERGQGKPKMATCLKLAAILDMDLPKIISELERSNPK